MNNIILKGIVRNIKHSHTIAGVDYSQAEIIVPRDNSTKEDLIIIKFKDCINKYKEGDKVELIGNVRSYSHTDSVTHKNKVELYVFTFQDIPVENTNNHFILSGRICKLDELRTLKSGNKIQHWILANNIYSIDNKQKLNNYLPCCCWDKLAESFSYNVNDEIECEGEFHSRPYTKYYSDGTCEFKTAYELVVTSIKKLGD